MSTEPHHASLGFTTQDLPAGLHICQIFSTDEDRLDAVLKFLRSGLEAGERVACFTDKLDDARLASYLAENCLSLDEQTNSGAFSKTSAGEVYFADGRFDPDRLLGLLQQFHQGSVADGFPAARVIGEMMADVLRLAGVDRLLEYEARVSVLLREHPITAVCQYDANAFDGATIMQVLKVHPLMVIRDAVVHNPFYVQPEDVLGTRC
ncbi:MEDS domain-containing protein [Candidatus Accumulibacter sp. ACC003]|uniref:MEDS domain-containing protein n=1 Tax=Candidatus Accumulibacter sp. ACC003 TaxID=2823334 RepID=UPI0025BDE3F5|nr:MEDS domain-containing protein [Candidatus Accumulibacter sp. ACC003]